MNIFGTYTSKEIKSVVDKPFEEWPEDITMYLNDIMAGELMDQWLYSHSDREYREYIHSIVDDLTSHIEDNDEDLDS